MYRLFDIESGRFGKSVCASRKLKRGTELLKFTGRQVGFEETLRLGDKESYALQVSPETYIYLDAPARFFNHSCDPSCGLRPDLMLVTLRDVASDEELNYDYSTTMLERKWTMDCACASALCRKKVTDFDSLPPERQEFYLREGVVQEFIRRALSPFNGER